jgi:N-acyl-D-amino-acid deacylase
MLDFMVRCWRLAIASTIVAAAVSPAVLGAPAFDVLIRGGTIYDGSGGAPVKGDVAIRADRIVAVGDIAAADARVVVDAAGLAVAPGFINMLSWSNESLIADGRSQSESARASRSRSWARAPPWGLSMPT